MTSRRSFCSTLAAAALPASAAATRPNILFVMVDEMRWDALGAAGHPIVKTPNLDRLARQGMRFANSYTVAPVCSPARATAFTGRYAHVHGVTSNAVPANRGEIYLPSILRHYGYHTAISGKLHFAPHRMSFGFDQFWSFSSEGPTPELGYQEYLRKKHGSPAKWPSVPGTCPWPDDPLGRDVGVFKYPQEDFETEWITDRSVDYLRSRKAAPGQPWFLFTSYLKPHSPSVEPRKYFEMYDPRSISVPKLPPNAKAIRAAQRGQSLRHYVDNEEMMRVMSAIYFGSIIHVDHQVGRLLCELDRLGMADNTLVLFTADHGNMLGDHARWFKGIMYEGSSHVPLIWRGPQGARENTGKVENRIVENTDLMPSILETAGLPVPGRVQGRSFLKLAREGDAAWKDRAYAQLRTAMVRTPEWKFIDNSQNLGADFELYDMRNDPKEQLNLAAEPKHRDLVEHSKRQLTAWRNDKPAPVKIAGLAEPDYARIGEEERSELIRNAPDEGGGRARPAGKRKR
ncbi:MAG: sulfatase-like hydrolase/transferase [Acidobacteria bacterium]|nr:sulfatase-like hydrolase/transferase [Acidobacteriota bacterium]